MIILDYAWLLSDAKCYRKKQLSKSHAYLSGYLAVYLSTYLPPQLDLDVILSTCLVYLSIYPLPCISYYLLFLFTSIHYPHIYTSTYLPDNLCPVSLFIMAVYLFLVCLSIYLLLRFFLSFCLLSFLLSCFPVFPSFFFFLRFYLIHQSM